MRQGGRPAANGMAPFSAITHRETHGADWAQAVDFTVVVTLRCDVQPLQLVAATRTHRRPWPVMIGILNDIGTRYPVPWHMMPPEGARSSPSRSRCTTSSTST